MTIVADFRESAFAPPRLDQCAKFVGRTAYWKLYAIENIFRVVVHTVLSAQLGRGWWDLAVNPTIRSLAERRRQNYAQKPWYSSPGPHDIYYTLLAELNEIIRANSDLFRPVVPDVDQWIVGLESLRLPRNVVGHMNYPGRNDQKRIDVFYEDCKKLVAQIAASGLPLVIPR